MRWDIVIFKVIDLCLGLIYDFLEFEIIDIVIVMGLQI